MIPNNPRLLNLAGFLACAGLMAYALYAEYVLFLDPCPLCIFQRVAVILLGLVFLGAALQGPHKTGRYVYAGLIGVIAAAGAGIAGWHVYLQTLPADAVASCGPTPDLSRILEDNALGDALSIVFTGSGECSSIDWTFIGLSMPAWVLIAVVALGAFGVWANLRSAPAADAP